MKRFFLSILYIILIAGTALAQKNDFAERKLSAALFQKNDIAATAFYNKKMSDGDSSYMVDYASSLCRLHQFSESYNLYKVSDKKKQIDKPTRASEFIQLTKMFDSALANSVDSSYEVMLLSAGYKKVPAGKSDFRYAIPIASCFNSDADDFGVCTVDNNVLFASTRSTQQANIENSLIRTYKLNNKNTCEVDSLISEAGILGIIGKLEAKFNCGPVNISKDKSKIFVTVNQSKKSKNGTYNLTILESHRYITGYYSELQHVPFDSVIYSVQHPFYDDHSGYLYFSSNMPGGAGGFDIYRIKYDGSNWGKPENITYANTAATEAFPSVDTSGNLYYSGKTVNGFGGLDIMRVEKGKTTPTLLEYPVNTAYDDFGMIVTDTRHGYFCSNRKTEKGGDNIYSYAIEFPPYKVALTVEDENSKAPLKDVTIEIKYADTSFTVVSNDSGKFMMTLPGEREGTKWNPKITLTKRGYVPLALTSSFALEDERNISISTVIHKEPIAPVAIIKATQVAPVIKVGVDLGKVLKLDTIYFDVNKWDIRPDAAIQLDKVANAMVEMPNLVIELGSHTDSRGSAQANQALSQKRAEASGRYILSKGIDPKRLTWKGYGEAKPLNKCKDGVKCTEKQYSVNRRTEFKIVKM